MKRIASYILFLVVSGANLFLGGVGAQSEWSPTRQDLEVISLRSAILVNIIMVCIIASIFYFAIWLMAV